MLKILIVFSLFIYSTSLWSQKEKEEILLKKVVELVYLDEFYDLDFNKMELVKDSIIDNYQISELDCDFISGAICKFYRIISSCKCEYIIGLKLDEGTLGKIYKLKGFRTSEFMYFFNYVLRVSVGFNKNKTHFILKNFFLEGIDVNEYYDYYIRKKNKNIFSNFYSCFEKKIVRAY